MTLEQINKQLKTINIPVAYRLFKKPVTPPFIVWFVENEQHFGSDFENLVIDRDIVIELCTNEKNEGLEQKVEALFNEYEIDKTDSYIADEELFLSSFDINFVLKK